MELHENPYASAVAKVFRDYVTTDASPFGIGAILAVVDKEQDELTPTVALAGKVTVLEAFAVLLAAKHWRATWQRLQIFAQGVLHRGPAFEQEAEQFDADVLTTSVRSSASPWKEPRCTSC